MSREYFIRKIEGPDIKVTDITNDVPKYFGTSHSPNVYYAYVTYKDQHHFIVRFGFVSTNISTNSIFVFASKGGRVGSVYNIENVPDTIKTYVERRQQLKDRKENPDVLEAIKQFLKEHGYKIARLRIRHYNGVMEYLTVNPIRFSVFVSVDENRNIVYRFNHHNGRPYVIPTDFANPECKALESLLTIIKYVSNDFEALEAKLKITEKI